LWEGWLEFTRAGDDEIATTRRESEQPNRADLIYWAQGLTQTYLEGALARALAPAPAVIVRSEQREFPDGAPRPSSMGVAAVTPRVVLDPFLTYAEGEKLLHNQLHALSRDHLQSIIEAYRFADGDESDWTRSASKVALVDRIIERVRARFAATGTSRTISPDIPASEQARE